MPGLTNWEVAGNRDVRCISVALWGALGHTNTARADARRASALLEECGAQGDAQKAQSLCETPHYAFCIVGEAGTIKTGVIEDLQALAAV